MIYLIFSISILLILFTLFEIIRFKFQINQILKKYQNEFINQLLLEIYKKHKK